MGRKTWIACSVGVLMTAVAAAAWLWIASRSEGRGPIGRLSPPATRLKGESNSASLRTTFQIVNRGDTDLLLGEPASTCGCTVASLTPRVLGPGASATGIVDATPPNVGEKTVEVTVPTNATDGSLRFRLTLVGSGRPPYITLAPGSVQLGETTARHAGAQIRLETREAAGSNPWIRLARSSIPELGVSGGLEDEQQFEAGIVARAYTYKIAPTSPLKTGDVTGELRFLSSGPDGSTAHTLPIHGNILARVYARPSRLYARLAPGSAPPRLHFSIMAADADAKLEVEPLEWPRDAVEVQPAGGTSSRIDFVAIPRPEFNQNLDAKVTLSTNDPDVPQVIIPLTLLRETSRP